AAATDDDDFVELVHSGRYALRDPRDEGRGTRYEIRNTRDERRVAGDATWKAADIPQCVSRISYLVSRISYLESRLSLPKEPPAIHHDRLSGDERRVVHEVPERLHCVLRRAEPGERRGLGEEGATFVVPVIGKEHRARRDAVHGDV